MTAGRYLPFMTLRGSRLHAFGGLFPDRSTPALDHWSLGLQPDGSVAEAESWRTEVAWEGGG